MFEERIEKAVEFFKSGYNCSQSVVLAFADMYGFTQEQAARMAASFGGGIGRMRQTCGAACGMFLLAGLETGATDPKDREGKGANYAVVQELAAEFKKRNGSTICAELLGLKKPEGVSTPEEREWMTRFLNAGFIDTFRVLHPEQQEYTWWSYRFNSRAKNKGWRIDYCMASESLKSRLKDAYILPEVYHSDHCPCVLEIGEV